MLLEDAAHATTPSIGQGAARAIEDAVALARAVEQAADLSAALHDYEAARRARTALILKLSRRADRAAQIASPLGCRVRDGLLRRLPARTQRRQIEPVVVYRP